MLKSVCSEECTAMHHHPVKIYQSSLPAFLRRQGPTFTLPAMLSLAFQALSIQPGAMMPFPDMGLVSWARHALMLMPSLRFVLCIGFVRSSVLHHCVLVVVAVPPYPLEF